MLFLALFSTWMTLTTLATTIDVDRSLIIRSPWITDSKQAAPDSPLGFVRLFSKVSTTDGNFFSGFNSWLSNWQTTTALNGLSVPLLPSFNVYNLWPFTVSGQPIAERAPFRLVALVYRPDFHEFRYVYALHNPRTSITAEYYVIFEFNLPTASATHQDWARRFAALSEIGMDQPEYMNQILAITDTVARPENLSAVRTNELFYSPRWELRHFQVSNAGQQSSRLEMGLTLQTPHQDFNKSRASELVTLLKNNAAAVLDGSFILPDSFLGSASQSEDENFKWLKTAGLPENIRSAFAIKTCNGCHTGETGTRFVHIHNRRPGQESQLSGFLMDELILRKKEMEQTLDGSAPFISNSIRRNYPH